MASFRLDNAPDCDRIVQQIWSSAGTTTRLLRPAEESALLARLSAVRATATRLLKPIVRDAPPNLRLDHFDQMVSFYQHSARLAKTKRRKIDRYLLEYNRLKHALVLANVAWVTKLARAQRQTVVSEEDLFQEGVCGLLKAIDRFEAERGLRLMTYATWYIREAMQQIRARQSHLVSLSSHDQTLLGRLEAHRVKFLHEHQRLPNATELEAVSGTRERTVSRLERVASPTVSLERSGSDGAIPVPVEDAIGEVDHVDHVRANVTRLLDVLPSRERMIVTRRFGLDGKEPSSLEVLGGDLNVSKERIRQLQRQAIRRMQQRALQQEAEFAAV